MMVEMQHFGDEPEVCYNMGTVVSAHNVDHSRAGSNSYWLSMCVNRRTYILLHDYGVCSLIDPGERMHSKLHSDPPRGDYQSLDRYHRYRVNGHTDDTCSG